MEKHQMTRDEAIDIATQYGLQDEVIDGMDSGMTPEEALEDWDILPDSYYKEYLKEIAEYEGED